MKESKMKFEIRNAMYELLQNKNINFDDLNVSMIADKIGVSRVTFYHHFLDIYDLFQWITTARTNEILNLDISSKQDLYLFLDFYFSIGDKNRIIIKKAVESKKNLAIYSMMNGAQVEVAKKILNSNYLHKDKNYSELDISILSVFLYSNFMNYLLVDYKKYSREEMVSNILNNFIEPFLNKQ